MRSSTIRYLLIQKSTKYIIFVPKMIHITKKYEYIYICINPKYTCQTSQDPGNLLDCVLVSITKTLVKVLFAISSEVYLQELSKELMEEIHQTPS